MGEQQTATAAAGGAAALRRMLVLFTVVALMLAMLATSVSPAFARGGCDYFRTGWHQSGGIML